jgi:MoxR-like ATPase
MKKLGNYIINEWQTGRAQSLVNEGRPAGSKNKPKDEPAPDLDDIKGQDEDENGSDGLYAVDAPTDDDILKGIDKETLNKNKKRILMRLKAKKPFFIQGEAGWGKTSIITDLAKRMGRTVITVYLDKAEAVDLGGIPVATKSKRGADSQKHLMPEWATLMWDNPKTQFLLFFDEMNQATPDVMNALMPIVKDQVICGKKCNNFVVGAAGNFERENEGGITELSIPLKSRFGGVIEWESGDWKDAFAHLHKKWDDKLSKKFLDFFEETAPELFNNPRDIETFILETVSELKEAGDVDYLDAEDYYDQLKGIAKNDLPRSADQKLKQLGEQMYKFVNNIVDKDEKDAAEGKKSRKNSEMIPQEIIDAVKKGMRYGFIEQREEDGSTIQYGISRENVYSIEDSEINREQMERLVRKLEADGLKFKFEKDSEWKAKGYKDPNKDY